MTATTAPTNTHIFTNREGNTLMREFEGVLTYNPLIKHLDAVVGFLRASGYFSLRPFLDNIDKVRVLIGIDVDKYIAMAAQRGGLFRFQGAEEEVKGDYLAQLRADIEKAGYRKEIEDGIFQMVADLTSGKLELRAHPSKKIHAKIYILYPNDFNQYAQGMAITGSSNLSGNGLGISQDNQYEFNVKLSQYDDVAFAKDEFEQLWSEAANCPITADDIAATINKTYLRDAATPYDIYMKVLMEYFSDRVLAADSDSPLSMPEGYTSYEYQLDAVIDGYQKLLRYDGFFLADVVGLGKTVVATMIAKKFLVDNGKEHTKILVVYPPALEQNWKCTFRDFGIYDNAKFITNGSLSKIFEEDNYDYWRAEDYDLILVDEAHKFRTRGTNAFKFLQDITKMPRVSTGNIKGYKKKVMLISATPMNNSPEDIYNQLLLFQDPRHCTIDGVANLAGFFNPLIKEFKELRQRPNYDGRQFTMLAERVRERVIKPITVRRTRTDIENIARYRDDIGGFPVVEQPIKKGYELTPHLADLFEQAMHTLTQELTYARYRAIEYLLPEAAQGNYEQAELVSHSLANIRKNGLVKRLESSFHAFIVSLGNFRQANKNMIDMFANDKVYIAPDLDINKFIADGLTEDEIEEKISAKAEHNPKNKTFAAADFREEFLPMLRKDQEKLDAMCDAWQNVGDSDDSKFATFAAILEKELFNKKRNREGKLVVFSEAIDTVNYLRRRIGRPDVLVITSQNRNNMFTTICENFDANYKTHKDDYNIILTTDVLAEGINLHRANVIVNYDTPWNATRLMQRIGRVNRIGGAAPHIYNYVFYPSREGNNEINLNTIVLSKIQTFHTTFGEDNKVYSPDEQIDRDLDRLFDDTIQRKDEEKNAELEYYEELRDLYMHHRREYERIARLPLRTRTGRYAREVDGVTLSQDTLLFIKTNFRKLFFLVGDKAEEQTAVEAMAYFKAAHDEAVAPRIAQHYDHVEKALAAFYAMQRDEALAPQQAATATAGGQLIQALSLIDTILSETDDSDDYEDITRLRVLVERGTIADLAKRLQQRHRALIRQQTTLDDVKSEITTLAKKYAPYYVAEQKRDNTTETAPEVILSESFT